MATTTVYPFGPDGRLPGGIGIVNDKWTGGANMAGSAEMVKELNAEMAVLTAENISSITAVKAFIGTSTDQWAVNNSNWKCKFLAVIPGTVYLVKANASKKSWLAVLKDNTYAQGETADYATGCSLVGVPKGTYYQISIPSDGAYLYIGTLANGDDVTPESVSKVTSRFNSYDEKIAVINSQRINIDGFTKLTGWIIGSNNVWSNQGTPSSDYASICIPITAGNKYILVSGATLNGIFALLTSDAHSNGSTPAFCEDYPARFRVPAGEALSITAPNDAAFIYITLKSSGDEFGSYAAVPKTVDEQFQEIEQGTDGEDSAVGSIAVDNLADAIGNKLYPLNPNLDENGYVLPDTLQELNVVRKAQQMANVVWTPLSAVPYHTWNNPNLSFPAGTPVTGLPYSSVKELDKYIMKDVSLYTFMTAVNNPYSLLYTENVSEANSQSAWGKTYHGVNATCYYGTVCSEFTAICSGAKVDYATATHDWLDRNHYIVKVYDQSAQGARRGDIFWKSGHCRLIYAVKKNSAGEVTHIKIAESTYGTCLINSAITAAAFNNEIKNDGCIIYRPLWMYKNNDYAASPFVAVGDETPQTFTYNDDICCFAGDKAAFREGDTIAVNYNLKSVGAWTHMQLYKGSTLLDTIAIDTSAHVVDLTSRNLTYGKYKARLTDGTNYSEYTEWQIIQTNVSVVVNGGIATITASSANAVKTAVKVCPVSGGARCMRELTEDEQNAASFDLDVVALNRAQGLTAVIGATELYLKVYFRGDFGQVTNEGVPVQFTM